MFLLKIPSHHLPSEREASRAQTMLWYIRSMQISQIVVLPSVYLEDHTESLFSYSGIFPVGMSLRPYPGFLRVRFDHFASTE